MKGRNMAMKITRQLVQKVRNRLIEGTLFANVRNKNVRSLAYREYCYKRLRKKNKGRLRRKKYKLETPDNIIWVCWLQGIEKAPTLVKTCIDSLQGFAKDKKIVIITEKNYHNYISLPNFILKKRSKGYISDAHFSDLLRLELLTSRGGIWIDSTVLLTGRPVFFEQKHPLFVFKNVTLDRRQKLASVASNWFICSWKNEPILQLTKELLYDYWKKHNGVEIYSVFHLFFSLATEVYAKEWDNVPSYSNIPPHILQFELTKEFNRDRWRQITQMSDIHKLNHRVLCAEKNTYYSYILEKKHD